MGIIFDTLTSINIGDVILVSRIKTYRIKRNLSLRSTTGNTWMRKEDSNFPYKLQRSTVGFVNSPFSFWSLSEFPVCKHCLSNLRLSAGFLCQFDISQPRQDPITMGSNPIFAPIMILASLVPYRCGVIHNIGRTFTSEWRVDVKHCIINTLKPNLTLRSFFILAKYK